MSDMTGQNVPNVEFINRHDHEWQRFTSNELFKGKKVVVFSLPGAFTPTCSNLHLPRYEDLYHTIKHTGIDEIYCVSVNDGFVMDAWRKYEKVHHVKLLADGNGEFTKAMGMLTDKSAIGFGKRSRRYSMVVNDCVIEKMFIEADQDGDPFEVSDAETMLKYLSPESKIPSDITVFSRPNCPFCKNAKTLLESKGLTYQEIKIGGDDFAQSTLRAVVGHSSVPQIFIDGKHIGGEDDLANYFNNKSS